MSSVLATRDHPGPSTRSVRAPPGANAERIRPGGGGEPAARPRRFECLAYAGMLP